jgi:hypothetical protein
MSYVFKDFSRTVMEKDDINNLNIKLDTCKKKINQIEKEFQLTIDTLKENEKRLTLDADKIRKKKESLQTELLKFSDNFYTKRRYLFKPRFLLSKPWLIVYFFAICKDNSRMSALASELKNFIKDLNEIKEVYQFEKTHVENLNSVLIEESLSYEFNVKIKSNHTTINPLKILDPLIDSISLFPLEEWSLSNYNTSPKISQFGNIFSKGEMYGDDLVIKSQMTQGHKEVNPSEAKESIGDNGYSKMAFLIGDFFYDFDSLITIAPFQRKIYEIRDLLFENEIQEIKNKCLEKWISVQRRVELAIRSHKRTESLADNLNYIYVMSNKAYPDTFKIGWTSILPEERAEELSSTGVLYKFKVEHYKKFKDAEKVEGLIHKNLKKYRVANNKEFFKHPLDKIVNLIETI